mmetsp:Transcript_27267/g.55798  ORF Transcript_27267/g.55798 Transcript_27267/m.55798 type:complete len:200 (-) Transcript_27267:65-664(-)
MFTPRLQRDGPGEASNKGEEAEDGDEEELEPVSIKAKGELVNNDVVADGRCVDLGPGRSSEEGGHDGAPLLPLEISEAIIIGEIYVGLGLASLGGLSVECGVALNLKSGIGEIGDGPPLGGGLVSAAGDAGDLELAGRVGEGRVALRSRGSSRSGSGGSGGGGLLSDSTSAEGSEGRGGADEAGDSDNSGRLHLAIFLN